MWRYQYEHFAPTHHIVLIDSPGHDKSDALRTIIDLKDCADVLVEILDGSTFRVLLHRSPRRP